jgi:hypothetical protein
MPEHDSVLLSVEGPQRRQARDKSRRESLSSYFPRWLHSIVVQTFIPLCLHPLYKEMAEMSPGQLVTAT